MSQGAKRGGGLFLLLAMLCLQDDVIKEQRVGYSQTLRRTLARSMLGVSNVNDAGTSGRRKISLPPSENGNAVPTDVTYEMRFHIRVRAAANTEMALVLPSVVAAP